MKALVASLVIITILGSSNVLASDLADGFDWPYGFSPESSENQHSQKEQSSGFNYPYGFSPLSNEAESGIAYGFDWPMGS